MKKHEKTFLEGLGLPKRLPGTGRSNFYRVWGYENGNPNECSEAVIRQMEEHLYAYQGPKITNFFSRMFCRHENPMGYILIDRVTGTGSFSFIYAGYACEDCAKILERKRIWPKEPKE